MSKINFLQRFLTTQAYLNIKSTLPYPSICLTDDTGNVWIKGKTDRYTVHLYSNAQDGVITIGGTDYTFTNGELIISLDEGSYTYTMTKGSLADEKVLIVSPTTVASTYEANTRGVSYTAYTTTYLDSLSGSLVVTDNISRTINFPSTTTQVTPTWTTDGEVWALIENNVLSIKQNDSGALRETIISAVTDYKTATISISQTPNANPTGYTYLVENVQDVNLEWNATSYNVIYDGVTIGLYDGGMTARTDVQTITSSTFTIAANDSYNAIDESKSFAGGKYGTVNYNFHQNNRPYTAFTVTPSTSMTFVISGDNGTTAYITSDGKFDDLSTTKTITTGDTTPISFGGQGGTNYVISYTGTNAVASAVTALSFTSSYTFPSTGGTQTPILTKEISVSGNVGTYSFTLTSPTNVSLTEPITSTTTVTGDASTVGATLSVSDTSWMSIQDTNDLVVEEGTEEKSGTITGTIGDITATSNVERTKATEFTVIFKTNTPEGEILIESID